MPQSIRKVIVTDALIRSDRGYLLHPALTPWQKRLMQARRQWFASQAMLPLQWYAAWHGVAPAAVVAASFDAIPADAVQCFIASPYHAQMARDRILVMPESMFQWHEAQGRSLCEALNPLLAEDGLTLASSGVHLLLFSGRRLDASPASFAALSGRQLPDRHPQGADGAFLMRLTAEVQMMIHRNPMHTSSGAHPLHGLWFWGACDLPYDPLPAMKPVATRNPPLRALCEGRDAAIAISEAEYLAELLPGVARFDSMPAQWLLAGEGAAVLATPRRFPWLPHKGWQPYQPQSERALNSVLVGF